MTRKAVVLVSGGLDSATVLALAQSEGYDCYALSFDYGQRHVAELDAARRVTQSRKIYHHQIITLNLRQFGGSALTDDRIDVPTTGAQHSDIPVTYVPARNTIMLSIALGWAEVLGAFDIFIGANAVDYSGYPDCRPVYLSAFETMANLATKVGVNGQKIRIRAPIVQLSKAQIIQQGIALGVDFGLTVSCYQANALGHACGVCDSCRIRQQGFADANIADPTLYQG